MSLSDRERFEKADQIFDDALSVAPEQLSGWLDAACGGDAELRALVERLLAGVGEEDRELIQPVGAQTGPLWEEVASQLESGSETVLRAGAQIGSYVVVGLLGAGSMGRVYRARDPQLDREVAIKTLPVDVAQDPERLRRFNARPSCWRR